MVIDFDDFGATHVITGMCESHDCRGQLDKLHFRNMNFRVTLFAIPDYMTTELLNWCKANESWVELAVHGIGHTSNYECEKMTYEEFDKAMKDPLRSYIIDTYFKKIFKAPGWQISDGIFKWLKDNDWIVADQSYNNDRRPEELKAYVNFDGKFKVYSSIRDDSMPDQDLPTESPYIESWHGHTWNVGEKGSTPNGIYEAFDEIVEAIKGVEEFKFVSELFA